MPRTYLIHFHNVGRQKKSWSANTTDISPENLAHIISAKHVLRSADIDAHFLTSSTGSISAGFHNVGNFTIPSLAPSPN